VDASTTQGHAGIGIYAPGEQLKIAEGLVRIPEVAGVPNPNNWAELSAIFRAMQLFGHRTLTVRTDSKWCDNILNGRWQAQKYRRLVDLALRRKAHYAIKVEWVSRDENEVADSLATWASGYTPEVIR
jgi:ribonuclease HI